MDIVIATLDTSHAAPTNLRDFLQGLGHTVTIVSETSVNATNLDSYDNIIAVRNSEGLTAMGDYLRGYIAKGKWVACGAFTGNSGASSMTTPAVLVGMPGPETVGSNNSSPQLVVRSVHPILNNRQVGETFEWLLGTEFSNSIPYEPTIGLRLASLEAKPSSSAIHLFSASDLGISVITPGGCGIYFGCIYNRGSFGIDAPDIMNAILQARPALLAGTVQDSDSLPAERTVRAYLRSTGQLASAVSSSSGDGSFSMTTWLEGEHTVVALPDALDENALVFDRIVPEPIQ